MDGKATYEELERKVKNLEAERAARKKSDQALWESERLYRSVVENSHDGIVIIDDQYRVIYGNTELGKIFNQPLEEIIGYDFREAIDKGSRDLVARRYQLRHMGQKLPSKYEFDIIRKDGEKRRVEIKSTVIKSLAGGPITIAQILDITDRKKAEKDLKESEEQYRSILENIEDGYFEVDSSGNLIFFNDSLCKILQYDKKTIMGVNNREIMDKKNSKKVLAAFNRVHRTGNPIRAFEMELIRKDGSICSVEASVSLVKDPNGRARGFRGIIRDISDRKEYEKQLSYQATHDVLTGLYNRKAFLERLERSLLHAKRYFKQKAVLFIDLDMFKKVNDIYGHVVGDKLLIEVAKRLKKSLRETDYVCRFGGDEFTVILNNPDETHPEYVSRRIVKSLSRSYLIHGKRVDFISASIGISRFPYDGTSLETLINHADQAMYKAKNTGNTYVCYKHDSLDKKETLPLMSI